MIMAHPHQHIDNDKAEDTGRLRLAFFLNLSFAIVELVGGILTNSVAILSDALHDLGDTVSLGSSWIFQKVSKRKRDRKYSYGYRRFSVLGALLNSLVLFGGSVLILYEAIPRLFNPEMPDAKGMLILAVIGILVNGFAVLKLKGGSSLNERAVRLHLLEDVLGWIAILIGSILLMFWEIPIIDPILSILISIYILFNVFRNIRDVLSIFLQARPGDVEIKDLEKSFADLPGIINVHDLHIWSMDGNYHVLSVHLVVDRNYTTKELVSVKDKLNRLVEKYGINHATYEFETEDEDCKLEDC
jgi:cobalt-zinc-cadmium efflux system protein